MKQITLEDERKFQCALMLGPGRARVRFTRASFAVASIIFKIAKTGRDTTDISEVARYLDITQKRTRTALQRVCAAKILEIERLPASRFRFSINWGLLDEIADAHDRDMAEYWRLREAEEDQDDPDAP